MKDYAIWKNSEDGKYTNKSAWNIVRNHRTKNFNVSHIWHSSVPFKFSFICWRLYFGKLPFNDVKAKFGNQDDIECLCCSTLHIGTIQHVFVQGESAINLWEKIGAPLGIKHQNISIRRVLQYGGEPNLRMESTNSYYRFPPLSYAGKFGKLGLLVNMVTKEDFYQYNMVIQCILNIKAAINNSFPKVSTDGIWSNMCDYIERLKPVVKCLTVCWNKPDEGKLKLNTDGSFIRSNNKAGISGVLRNDQDDFIMAFSLFVDCFSSNHAEAMAANYGSRWCIQHGLNNFDIELDSAIITNMSNQKDTNNLKLKHIIQDTTNTLRNANATFSHCFREANQVVDFLAKNASTSGNSIIYTNYQDLPREVKGILHLDKLQMPNFRRRFEKCNFFVS
ncbi:uncharacterized protein LOC132639326 [Lycium barbarum]|uniref:uncharacterized protein LOC132639326 n=1 Tax=Lycium barbarum TaxID=112863 RepID=UPI00293E6686|nr:uncharacterized protein LOC132639326 [Lycium barbarum]